MAKDQGVSFAQITMNEILTEHLIELSDSLDKAGKTQCSNAVDGLIKNKSVTKIAQYVGAIGYVLKQNRAMENCVRKKRVTDSGSMQEVVLGCLKEYQTGQEYGNNDWTAKYAQVIEDSPENFESLHRDFLNVIAQENDISDHMIKVREAGKVLIENKIDDSLFKAILADLDQLDALFKEGDADHRPFKLAAPRSQRGFWNRLFSPSGSRRGIQKDTELEMDNVLESISIIAQSAQQIRNSISAIQFTSTSLGRYPAISSAASNLSPSDWNRTLQATQALQAIIGSSPPDPNLFQLRELIYGVSNNIGNVYNQIELAQRNMFNLRQRDPVKGRTYGPSTTEEFGHLEMALEKLIRNPLDERALFYAQKLHGRLEDALNMRSTKLGPDFQKWIDTYQGPSQFEPIEPESPPEEREPLQTKPDGSMEGIGQQLSQALGLGASNELIKVFEEMAQSDFGTKLQADNILELLQGLRTPAPLNEGIGNLKSEDMPVGSSLSPAETQQARTRYDHNTILDVDNWDLVDDDDDEMTASNVDTFVKIADIVDGISPEIANILNEYIAKYTKEEESSFEFPENALIMKEDIKST